MRSIIAAVFAVVCFATRALSAQIDLPRDSEGWTVFTPSSDSRIVYVSSSGSDSTGVVYTSATHPSWSTPFEPGAISPFATYAAAYAAINSGGRSGYPDWILLKRGDTFEDQYILRQWHSGRSATEPFLVGAYGTSGLSPVFETGTESGIYYQNAIQWAAFVGLHFYANGRDPNVSGYSVVGGPGFYIRHDTGIIQGMLFEGCKFNFFESNAIGAASPPATGTMDGVTIRRTVITNSYPESSYQQGFYAANITDLVMEDNILDHNGWYDDYTGTIGVAGSMSHNVYLPNLQDSTISGNISARSSHTGLKFTATYDSYNSDVINNLIVASTVCIDIGTNNPSNVERFFNPNVSNNVCTYTGYENPSSYITTAWGIVTGGWVNGVMENNLLLDDMVTTASHCPSIYFYQSSHDVLVTGNIAIGQNPEDSSIRFKEGYTYSNITVDDNNFEIPGNYSAFLVGYYDYVMGGVFTNNTWYSNSTYFGESLTKTQWQSTEEPTATFDQRSYADRTRTILTYLTSIGETATLDNFYALIDAQERYTWDDRLTADAINTYLRVGFGLAEQAVVSGDCTDATWAAAYVDDGPASSLCDEGIASAVVCSEILETCTATCYGSGGGSDDYCSADFSVTEPSGPGVAGPFSLGSGDERVMLRMGY